MKQLAWLTMFTALAGVGCSRDLVPDDTGRDTNGDGDTDPDDDRDTDPDTFSDDLVDCRETYDTPDPGSIGGLAVCETDELFCGDFIRGTTVNGSTQYSQDEYSEANFGGISNWDAAERIYYFRQNEGVNVRFVLYTPCRDLHLFMCLGWECATEEAIRPGDCSEALTRNEEGGYYRDIPGPGIGTREFEVIVEGRDGDEGNYGLEVICD